MSTIKDEEELYQSLKNISNKKNLCKNYVFSHVVITHYRNPVRYIKYLWYPETISKVKILWENVFEYLSLESTCFHNLP